MCKALVCTPFLICKGQKKVIDTNPLVWLSEKALNILKVKKLYLLTSI